MNYAEYIRQEFGKSDARRDRGLETPEEIIRFDDLPYGEDEKWQILDIYRPREAGSRTLPVIVNVHGGGFVYGTKETYQFYCMSLAMQGFAVVNYTYRLAPEHKFPAALEDCCRVFGWVLDNAHRYGLNPQVVFAVGDSAGATILGQFCNLCTNPSYRAQLPACQVPKGFVPTAVALNCGEYLYHPTPLTPKPGNKEEDAEDLSASLRPYVFEQGGTPEEIALANVVGHVTGDFPPAVVMTSQDDFLKMSMLDLLEEFLKKDVAFMSQYYVDPNVRLGHVFHCNMRMYMAHVCNREQVEFFQQFEPDDM